MPEFATCSFPEYRPEQMGGIPVRTSNGFPRYTLKYPLTHTMPLTYPAWKLVKSSLSEEAFNEHYRAQLDRTGLDAILDQARDVRANAGVDEGTPLVFLCFEQLAKKPGAHCHRSTLAAWISDQTNQPVPEFGALPLPQPEIRAQDTLF